MTSGLVNPAVHVGILMKFVLQNYKDNAIVWFPWDSVNVTITKLFFVVGIVSLLDSYKHCESNQVKSGFEGKKGQKRANYPYITNFKHPPKSLKFKVQ